MPRSTAQPSITSNFHNIAEVKQAMLVKLKTSSLTAKDAARLGMESFTAQQVQQKLGHELTFYRAGFQIPYFTMAGKKNCFYRFRYLEYDNGKGFSKLTHTDGQPTNHDVRYVQPANTLPELYLPPTVPWAKLSKAVDVPLTITEGELKAACACKYDIPTLGLGGVWSFKSSKAGLHLLPIFEQFVWEERLVYICYDSDASSNPNVCAAEDALARELTTLGAKVYVCRLPAVDDKKMGIDDYITALGKKAFEEDVQKQAMQYTASVELFKLNGEVVYVKDPGVVLVRSTLQRITPRAFMDHAYADRVWYETVGNGKTQKTVERCAPKEWIKWPHRALVQRTTYRPGQPQFTTAHEFNVWPGWGCEPKKGDVSLWLRHLEYIFADHDDAKFRIQWFQQWLAYPLQFPGTKLNQTSVIWSVDQGTGKSIMGYIMRDMYGKSNFAEINDKQLEGSFNGWAENRQFVMGDEIASTGERRQNTADRMKSIITQNELRINVKYIPEYTVPDCVNYYFTSNHPDAFFMEDTDRRFFISEVKRRPLSPEYYKKFCDWALNGGPGASYVFYHLLHFDLDGFDPNGHAPMTSSKLAMQHSSLRGPVEAFAYDLRHHREETLGMGAVDLSGRTLFTIKELLSIANDEKNITDGRMLGRALARMKFRKVCDGYPIHGVGHPLGTRASDRLWAIVNTDISERYDALDGPQAACIHLNERKEFKALSQLPKKERTFPSWYKPHVPTVPKHARRGGATTNDTTAQ